MAERIFETCDHPVKNLHLVVDLKKQGCVSVAYPREMGFPSACRYVARFAAVPSIQLGGSRWTELLMDCHVCGLMGLAVYWKADAEVEATALDELSSVQDYCEEVGA